MLKSLVAVLVSCVFAVGCGETTKTVEVCPAEQADCQGICASLETDTQNCGACGTVCGATETCVAGECTAVEGGCGDLEECDGACTDTQNDPGHCGACGTACTADQVCDAGDCVSRGGCGALDECDGACTDTQNDPAHCGDCVTACGAEEICDDGTCAPVGGGCGDLAECDGACTDTQNDPTHCGDCVTACGAEEICDRGTCTLVGAGCGLLAECGGACVDTRVDPGNCGDCGIRCDAGEVCGGGVCTVSCGLGLTACARACVDADNDPDNCGGCGNVCGDGEGCVDRVCTGGAVAPREVPNGVGGTYVTGSSDERTNSRLACESVHGEGNCDNIACGSCNDRGYHVRGGGDCNGSVYWNYADEDQAMSCGWVDPDEVIVSYDGVTWQNGTNYSNGMGGVYESTSEDERTNARLACESVHGPGNCDTNACGSCDDRGYHEIGRPNCNGSVYWNFRDQDQAMSCGWEDPDEIIVSDDGTTWRQ